MDDGAERKSRRPRILVTNSGLSLLLTVLGELVGPAREPVWTPAVLHVLNGLELREHAARRAIARAIADGWVSGEKQGREVRLSLTAAGAAYTKEVVRRAAALSAGPQVWDRKFLVLHLTVSKRENDVRRPLRSALGSAGFGQPMSGLWLSPHTDRADEAAAVIDELGLSNSTIAFIGTAVQVGLADHEIVARAWDLDDSAARYEQLMATYARLEPESGDEVLRNYLKLIHEWHQMPSMDPQLPEDLLPNWIGRRASTQFVELRNKWTDAAHDRWRELSNSGPTAVSVGRFS